MSSESDDGYMFNLCSRADALRESLSKRLEGAEEELEEVYKQNKHRYEFIRELHIIIDSNVTDNEEKIEILKERLENELNIN